MFEPPRLVCVSELFKYVTLKSWPSKPTGSTNQVAKYLILAIRQWDCELGTCQTTGCLMPFSARDEIIEYSRVYEIK